jgi:hypothetical protein
LASNTLLSSKVGTAGALVAAALLVIGIGFAIAGSDDDETASTAGLAPPLPLISEEDIANLRDGSPEQAFLEVWSALQFQASLQAVSHYDPGLRRFIGTGRLASALESQSPFYRNAEPQVERTVREGELVTLHYQVRDATGVKQPHAVTFRELDGRLVIVHDTLATDALQTWEQNRVQQEVAPRADEPSPTAERAGQRLADRQAGYFERVLSAQP